jgi:hypothetical protein
MTLLGYNVYRGLTEAGITFSVYAGYTHTYVVDGLENGVEYFFTLAAVNEAGEGPKCEVVSATPLGYPSEPIDLTVTLEKKTVTLSWFAPANDGGSPIIAYWLYRGDTESPLEKYKELGLVTNYTDLDVEEGSTYSYSVVAVTALGTGDASTVVEIEIPKEDEGDAGSIMVYALMALVLVIVIILLVALMAMRKASTSADMAMWQATAEKEEEEKPAPTVAEDEWAEDTGIDEAGDEWLEGEKEYSDGWVEDE